LIYANLFYVLKKKHVFGDQRRREINPEKPKVDMHPQAKSTSNRVAKLSFYT
jgi:hypothetical protein